jgi:hypothetical protein
MKNKLNKNSLNYLAKESVSNLKCDISGVCQYGAELIAERFLKSGFSDFYIVEGYVNVPGWTGRTNHAWVELYDSSIIDPTFTQFPKGTTRLDSIYKKHNPKKYLQESKNKIVANGIRKYSYPITETLKEFISLKLNRNCQNQIKNLVQIKNLRWILNHQWVVEVKKICRLI